MDDLHNKNGAAQSATPLIFLIIIILSLLPGTQDNCQS